MKRIPLDGSGPVPPIETPGAEGDPGALVSPTNTGHGDRLRIALVATPRTGNTWIRTLLAEAYGLEQLAVHSPTGIPWAALPERLVVQIHWHRLAAFRHALRESGFRVVTIARNPLDVLVSILQFRQSDPTTEFWLSGEGGDERALVGASPDDPSFLRWAVSARARALLSVTPEWWADVDAVRVRYEDFVAMPEAAFADTGRRLGAEPVRDGLAPGKTVTFDDMRRRFSATPGHFWKGRPGMGAEVLDSAVAAEIIAAHGPVFQALEYSRHVPERSPAEARQAWKENTAPRGDRS